MEVCSSHCAVGLHKAEIGCLWFKQLHPGYKEYISKGAFLKNVFILVTEFCRTAQEGVLEGRVPISTAEQLSDVSHHILQQVGRFALSSSATEYVYSFCNIPSN